MIDQWGMWEAPPWHCQACDSFNAHDVDSCKGWRDHGEDRRHAPVCRTEPVTREQYEAVIARWDGRPATTLKSTAKRQRRNPPPRIVICDDESE